MGEGSATTRRTRVLALAIALAGLALTTYVEAVLTQSTAPDPLGWFVYEAIAWFALLAVIPFAPVPAVVLVGALIAFGLEGLAFWRVFVREGGASEAHLYLWKPLAQLVVIAATWLAGYLVHLRSQRPRAHG